MSETRELFLLNAQYDLDPYEFPSLITTIITMNAPENCENEFYLFIVYVKRASSVD